MAIRELVWLEEERTFAWIVSMGAFFSLVSYTRGGIDYEVLVDNEEVTHLIDKGGEKPGDNT